MAAKKAARRPADAPPVAKRLVAFPKEAYEARKDEVKAPLKEHGLKWQYLGEGQGRYHKEGVNVFVRFKDDSVHYALWGEDAATLDAILAAWRTAFGVEATAEAPKDPAPVAAAAPAEESEALRLWRIQEPQRRPGEPDLFFAKRTDEWRARRPAE